MFKPRSIILAFFLLVFINSSFSAEKVLSTVQSITNIEFQDKIFDFKNEKEWNFKGNLPCIIVFSADWCDPCTEFLPVLDELSVEYAGKINVFLIDIETEQEMSLTFGIQSIPSTLFVPKEGQAQMTVGLSSRETIVSVINDLLIIE